MIYRLRHTTRYAYAGRVDLAMHALHLRPRRTAGQRVLSERLLVDPEPARWDEGKDHFGNRMTWLFLDQPHDRLEVTSEALVQVRFPLPPDAAATPSWEALAAAKATAEAAEFAFASPMAPADAAAGAYAAASFPPGRPALAGLLELNARIRQDFTFRPGATSIGTPVSQILTTREGVCQDFTHFMIAALRALGLPARYTSGYVRNWTGDGMRDGADQSHAWVGAWLGPDHGWIHLDPTNGLVAQDEHVVVAWGRDYGDISPVRGVILGGGTHSLDVAVSLEPA